MHHRGILANLTVSRSHPQRKSQHPRPSERLIKTKQYIMALKWLSSFLLFHALFKTTVPQSNVETLPGYSGTLPFKLETGYIGVGEAEDVQLFYYFIESEGDPVKDPLLLWLTGGPGCSGFSGLAYEIGPLNFDFEAFDGSLPSLILNPYSWTKVASIIFLDTPVGTGYSYAKTSEGYHSSDIQAVEDIYTFLKKWLLRHPNFIKNQLYIAGDSYAGKWVPMVTWKISKGIEAGFEPRMVLQGYIIGNPSTDYHIDLNSRLPFAHRMALLSDKYYKMAKINCHGNYVNPNPKDAWCLLALQHYNASIKNIQIASILEPACKANEFKLSRTLKEDGSTRIIHPLNGQEEFWCRDKDYVPSSVWANDLTVQEALRIRNGTISEWKRCNRKLSFERNVESVLQYHHLLSNKELEALVYSGDHDMVFPYIGTLKWIQQLNLTLDDEWRQWMVDGQVAGYTERYIRFESQYYLTFATVKGAGHTAPQYKPKQCLAMIKRFLSRYPL